MGIDPRAEQTIRKVIPQSETILWAARSRGPSRRRRFFLMFVGLCLPVAAALAGFWAWAVWQSGSPLAAAFALGPLCALLFVLRIFAGEWFYDFAATDRRVIILCRLWPRSWLYLDYSDMNVHWVRNDAGRSFIKFDGFIFQPFRAPGYWSACVSYRGGMRNQIDTVPDIEAARTLILAQLARATTG